MASLTLSTNPVNRTHETFTGSKAPYEEWEVSISDFDSNTQTLTYTPVRKLSVGPVSITPETADVLNAGMANTRGANFQRLWIPVS